MAAKPVPDGYHTVTPYLTVRGASKVIEFLQQAFGAKISYEPTKRPDGSIMHAQVTIGDSPVMIADESEMAKATPSSLYLYVPNVDSVYQRAIKAGGKEGTLWYYRSLVTAFRQHGTSDLVDELERVVSEMERLAAEQH